MKLNATQREYLLRLTRGPQWLVNRSTPWWNDLWTRELIKVTLSSVYITEDGHAALADGGAQE